MATLTSPGDFPFFLLITAASPIALARYCSEVESTANRYLYPWVKRDLDAP